MIEKRNLLSDQLILLTKRTNSLMKDLSGLLLVILVAFLCFLPGLNSYGMLDPTDSFFIEAAREMLVCKHYIITLFNYINWYEKPVLAQCLTVICYKVFGISAGVGRLPAALSGIILVIGTYFFSFRLLGKRAALLAAVILCTSPLFVVVGHVALTDEVLSMLFGIAMLYIGLALSSGQKLSLWAYVFLALAVLCKGPIALILAGGSSVLYLMIVSDSWIGAKDNILRMRPITGVLIMLAICLPYFIAAHRETHGVFTEQFFLRQNFGRMQGTVNHKEAIWYYVPIFFGGYFPWCLYLLLSFNWLKRLFAFRFKLSQRQKFIVFCFSWFVFVGLLFVLVPTKLYTYIVPFSPAIAIVTAAYLEALIVARSIKRLGENSKTRNIGSDILIILPPLVSFIACMVSFFLFLIMKKASGSLLTVFCSGFLLAAIFSFRTCWLWHSGKYNKAMASLSLACFLACAILVPSSFCWFYQAHQAIFNQAIAIVKEKNGQVATLFSPVPSVIFALQHQVPNIESLPELSKYCQQGKGPHFLLASRNCLKMPELQAEKHTVISGGKWYLLMVDGFPW